MTTPEQPAEIKQDTAPQSVDTNTEQDANFQQALDMIQKLMSGQGSDNRQA